MQTLGLNGSPIIICSTDSISFRVNGAAIELNFSL
uniref:Uncharacterized protein n=1 Tax=Schistosoma japonicum TaxID=6182 RepID=Q5BY84_SCHJA|nr:unknown [Schistosoma japonicum]